MSAAGEGIASKLCRYLLHTARCGERVGQLVNGVGLVVVDRPLQKGRPRTVWVNGAQVTIGELVDRARAADVMEG